MTCVFAREQLCDSHEGHPSQWVGPGHREAIAIAAERERERHLGFLCLHGAPGGEDWGCLGGL